MNADSTLLKYKIDLIKKIKSIDKDSIYSYDYNIRRLQHHVIQSEFMKENGYESELLNYLKSYFEIEEKFRTYCK